MKYIFKRRVNKYIVAIEFCKCIRKEPPRHTVFFR